MELEQKQIMEHQMQAKYDLEKDELEHIAKRDKDRLS